MSGEAAPARVDPAAAPSQGRPPVVVHVFTVAGSLCFLRGQVSYVKRRGYTVHAISSPGDELQRFATSEAVPVHAVPMSRRITPVQDLVSLWRLWRVLRKIRPDIVHAHTPKGGLLGTIAAALAGVPARIYHIRGLPLVTAKGNRRRLLQLTERISCGLAHRVHAVSDSMREIAIRERLCSVDKIKVFRSGNGVDATGRFKPLGYEVRLSERIRLGIPAEALVIGFVGRLARDKGVVELASAWHKLRERNAALQLVLAGGFDPDDPIPTTMLDSLKSDPRVHVVGVIEDMPRLYAALDLVALPTYREGFPNVALETAAMALPIVATRVPGCVDAVEDGVTGTLVPAADASALAEALQGYLADSALRERHGAAGRRRVLAEFRQDLIWDAVADEYERLLRERVRSVAASRSAGT